MKGDQLDETSSEVAELLREAAELLDRTGESLGEFSDEVKDARQPLYRAESAVAAGQALIPLADPLVTPVPVATQVRNKCRALHNNVQQAAESGGSQGGTINEPAEELLTALIQLRQPGAPIEAKAKEAARRYGQSLAPRMRSLKTEIEGLEERLSELDQNAKGETAAAEQRIEELKQEIQAASTRVDQLISDQDAKFTEAQENRREEHAKAIAEADERLGRAAAEFERRKSGATERLVT